MAHNRYNNCFCLHHAKLFEQNFFFGVPMSFRRVSWVAAVALATLLELSCGQIYRPVVIPINITPPAPANFHAVFGISVNAPFNPGTALQIDVSGDSDIGQANMGINPTHAAILPNNSRVFVASAGGSLCPAGTDLITAFFPASDSPLASGLGTPTTFALPNTSSSQSAGITGISESGNVVTVTLSSAVSTIASAQIVIANVTVSGSNPTGYDGCFTISSVNGTTVQYVDPVAGLPAASSLTAGTATVPIFCPYIPVYLASSQNNAMFVANYGVEGDPNCNFSSTDSVAYLNTVNNTVGNIAYLPAASHPVAMVETPDALNLYVLNQGSNSVADLSPTDLSTLATTPVGKIPAWAVVRPDGQRLYVITQGDGELYTINTATNAVMPGSPQAVGGPGANFVLYDKSLNRLYVTNPTAGTVYLFDATADPPAPIGSPTGAISIAPPPGCTAATCSPVIPVSVAALPDGSRFYVASYATALGSSCPDPNVAVGVAKGCVIPQITVFDTGTLAVKTTVFPLMPSVASPVNQVQPFALASVTFCAPVIPYTPASSRFRMSAAASADGSRVYASMCDGGSVAIVNTTTSTTATGVNSSDNLVTDLLAPFSAGQPQANGEPLPQAPVFLLTGQ
jgi:DNA-binding beta-propeller fold protein YncE